MFLWAVIAIRCVRDGLQDIFDLDELERVIKDLPEGVESLYVQILNRIKPAYRKDAARFLQIVLYNPFGLLDFFRLYLIDVQRVTQDLPLICDRVEDDDLVQACYALKTRVHSHTLGLVDLTPTDGPDDHFGTESLYSDPAHPSQHPS